MARSYEESRKLQKRAEQLIPGGVNSPVRAFRVGRRRSAVHRARRRLAYLGRRRQRYIDYVGSWGPLILGHAAPEVLEAIIAAARNGTSFGASTPPEADLAELVLEAFPHMREGALREFGHGSDDVGDPPGARLHQAQVHHEV